MLKSIFTATPVIGSIIFLVYAAGRLSLGNEPALALIPAAILISGVVVYVLRAIAKENENDDD